MCPSGGGVSEPGFSSGVLANFDLGNNYQQTLGRGGVFHTALTPLPLAASGPVHVNELPASSSFATNVGTELSVDHTVDEITKCHLIDIDLQPLLNHKQNSQAAAESNKKDEVYNSRFRNHVYQVLMETGEGELLIQLYDFEQDKENLKELIESKKRTFFSIHKVARILVHHEIRRTNCYTITPERFEELAHSAVQLFPSHLKESFYTKPTANSNAHGVLQGYYESVREKAIAIKLIQPTRSNKRNREEEKSFSDAFEELKEPVSIIDDEYRRKWGRTATHEKIEFFKTCDIRTALGTFPNLANPAGYTLIQEDFCSFFNKPIDLFARTWPQIACKILKFAKTKTSDKAIKQILQSNEPIVADDKIQIVALILLPYLFKKIVKQTVRSKGQKNWYPEKHQVLDTFILQIKETEHFGEALQAAQAQLKELHTDHVLTLQPYVVISGVSLDAITSAYVIIDNYTYQVVSPVQAVDICFQFVKVLHDKFSHISKHVWQFLEREVYDFPVPDLYKGVSELIENLRKF